jgi:sulfur relay (sulfurtransferase) DsrF/TusC family protein
MNFQLIIIKSPPYQGRRAHEILEAIMSLALFDIKHRVVFFDSGLGWLMQNQQPEQQKSLQKQINALEMYGSEQLFYCQEHAPAGQTLHDSVTAVPLTELAQWIRNAKKVEVF